MMQKLSNRGIALVVAIMFVVVMVIISGAILIYMYNQTALNYREARRQKAIFACEAALNYAYQKMARGHNLPAISEIDINDNAPATPVVATVTINLTSDLNQTIVACSTDF